MPEYLYKVSLYFDYCFSGDKSPVYAVARSKKEVLEYVTKHLKRGCSIKTASLLGERLGMNMYHGKPKRRKKINEVKQFNTQQTH